VNTSTLTDTVTDAVHTGATAVQEFALAAVELASELPDKATDLAAVARDRIGGAPPPRTIRPWMIVAAAVVAFVVAGWWFRRRRQGPAVDIGPDGRNPVREHTDRAASAVGS